MQRYNKELYNELYFCGDMPHSFSEWEMVIADYFLLQEGGG